jgi:CDP-diacylglycerol--glycerol-3-phosphate 3-phosphatidyltransferase
MSVPMLLTWLRVAMIPLCVVVFYLPLPWAHPAAAGVFAVAGLTDWFDGYLARRLGQTSAFGAFLDPVADKLMVATALVLIVDATARHAAPVYGMTVAVSAVAIIGRELIISALREWMATLGASARVAVSQVGKVKTTLQMVALTVLLYEQPIFGISPLLTGVLLLVGAALLTLWSMVQYLRAAWPTLRAED